MGEFRFAVLVITCLGWLLSGSGLAVDCPGLAITLQPVSQTACPGENVQFSIEATGVGQLTWQWRKDCVVLVGETEATLWVGPVGPDDYATYDCVVTDDCGVLTSQTVSLTTEPTLAITAQPVSTQACTGFSATFEVSAEGTNLFYQWRRDCMLILGEESSTLTLNGLTLDDEATYDCVVWNDCGTLTSQSASLTLNQSPTIYSSPDDINNCVGDRIYFKVAATGTEPLSYQWSKDGVPIPGATNLTLILEPGVLSDEGSYTCEVSNSCNSVVSSPSVLDFRLPPVISGQPQSVSFCDGDDVAFTVTASDVTSYQWRKDCVPIPGATNATLNLTGVTSQDLGSYSCVLENFCGFTTSQQAALLPGAFCNFPDPALREFVESGSWQNASGNLIPIDLNGDGYLSLEEASAVDGLLDVSGLQLTSLEGIGVFANLSGLICSRNLLTSFPSEFNQLTSLTLLRADKNLLEIWPDLTVLVNLVELDLSHNRLNQAAGRGTIFPTTLQSLSLDNNGLKDLPYLSGLNNLNFLSAVHNRLTNTQTLAAQTIIGSDPSDEIHLNHNLLTGASRGIDPTDCSAIQGLLVQAAGAVFNYNPQFNFSLFPQWPNQGVTILDLLDNLEITLSCDP